MTHSRRSLLGLGAAAAAALMLTSMHIPEAKAAVAGADHAASGWRVQLVAYIDNAPQLVGEGSLVPSPSGTGYVVAFDNPAYLDAMTKARVMFIREAFVDGVYNVPGGAQLKGFYHDLYRPYGPTRTAAMQPDNGAGQVSGDRAQSVGRAGDLKATRPDGVKSGTTPGAKAVDATKPTSWLRRIGPWLFRQPVPS